MSSELDAEFAPEAEETQPDFISYDDMLRRLALRYPEVPMATIESIARDEYEVITNGVPHMVPRLVEVGTLERLDALADR